jgi:PhoH-like ATPase
MTKYVIDTNVLISYPKAITLFDHVILPTVMLEEIDGLKKDREVGYSARQAHHFIKAAKKLGKITFEPKDTNKVPKDWDTDKRDNKIIMCAKDNKATLVTNDINMQMKAEAVGVEYEEFYMPLYKGYEVIEGDTEYITSVFEKIENGLFNTYENEYFLFRNTETGDELECRFSEGKLVDLELPPEKVIEGWNTEQRFALDLLNNKDIPIKVIAGNYGSGKTKLSAAMGVYLTQCKDGYSKLLMIRNPIGSGEDIGFLPGGFDEKTGNFFEPVIDCLEGGEQDAMRMEDLGMLEKAIPFHIKGKTFEDTFMLVDEAEDLTLKILKLVGSRVGQNSCIVFAGDYKQAEAKFISDNGLLQFIDKTKGNPLVGIVVLPEDVRSNASKVFAEI